MSREIASSNQWREATGPPGGVARVIDHPDHAGFITFADSGVESGFMIDDPNHAGFTTPDDGAGPADSLLLIVGGVFATPA